jgi:ribonuclease Y
MKGRIIGREGRNIRAFEQVTGVNVLIDDTPGSVLLSSFDPVRRETARIALEELVADGRIHPQRIEEAFERSRVAVDERIEAAAREALESMGISDLHPALVPVVGALRYRTSNGQNVLAHLVECGHLAGLIAAELGLDAAFCRRAAFLHDLGKAVSHEHEGSHALVGADLARRYGEHPDIVHAIEAHHNEVEPRTVEAVLVQVVDSISGSRPGARRESLEAYVHRLERLEKIATSHEGVERAFAVQAGRDVRVMVSPTLLDDEQAAALARQIAKEISEELTFPGQIRVTVVRESRAVEIAS